VGPVVLTGMGLIADGIVKKAAAVVLMGSWAVGVGLVAGSNESYLDVTQRLFAKGEVVRAHEQSLARARVALAASEKEVTLRAPREVTALSGNRHTKGPVGGGCGEGRGPDKRQCGGS
jgi:hypothetical protein